MDSDGEKLDDELEREQSLVDLEKAIGERGRLRSEEKQSEIEADQSVLDEDRAKAGNGSEIQRRGFEGRQDDIDRARAREEALQDSLDRAEKNRDEMQREIDRRRESCPDE